MAKERFKDVVYRNLNDDSEGYRVHALVLTNCNGTGPVSFSKAYVEYNISSRSFPRLAFFGDGFIRIAQAMKGEDSFRGHNTYINFEQMVFKESKHLQCLKYLIHNVHNNEASIRNTLAAHYFWPLAYGSKCLVDKGSSTICEYCKQQLSAGDTSLGHSSIWHGRADIIIKSSIIKVTAQHDDDEDDNDDDESKDSARAKKDQSKTDASFCKNKLEKADSFWTLSQALAQAIVNGFCETRKKKYLLCKFIPSFMTTEKTIRIIWYNCDLDILLLSNKMQIWNDEKEALNIDTLIQVWLALNFENYDMNVNDKILETTNRFNFKGVVGEKIYSVYCTKASKPYTHVQEDHNPKTVLPLTDDSLIRIAHVTDFYYREIQSILD